jgi:hypothetical protein
MPPFFHPIRLRLALSAMRMRDLELVLEALRDLAAIAAFCAVVIAWAVVLA